MKPGDWCRITSGALKGSLVQLLYFDQIIRAWRVAGGGYAMWYKPEEIEVVDEAPDLDEFLDT